MEITNLDDRGVSFRVGVDVNGSTLSSLAQDGWPTNRVQIDLWIYSQNYALVLE